MGKSRKQANLKRISTELSKILESRTPSEIQSIYDSITNCFNNEYKINYSDSYQIAKALTSVEDKTEYVFENLTRLMEKTKKVDNQIAIDVHKLLDYISLECARCVEYNKFMRSSEVSMQELFSKHNELVNRSSILQEKIESAQRDLEKSQVSAITVIGLFSAIIMSFFGGISFSRQALTALSMSSPIRLVFVLSLIGFILFNLLFLILYIVGKLTGKRICSRCLESNDETKKVCTCEKQSLSCKLIRRYPYVLWTNAVLLFLMVDMAAIWISTLFFYRNFDSVWVIIITGVTSVIFVAALVLIRFKARTPKSKNKS